MEEEHNQGMAAIAAEMDTGPVVVAVDSILAEHSSMTLEKQRLGLSLPRAVVSVALLEPASLSV